MHATAETRICEWGFTLIGFDDLPRGLPRELSKKDSAPRAIWVAPEGLPQTERWAPKPTAPLVGQDRNGNWICLNDDRHLLTVAGSRAGKGVSVILPNLAIYKGSVLVLDPKGENATLTAERRGHGRGVPAGGMGHDVFVLDPFGWADVADEYRSSFNPLADLDPQDPLFVDHCDSIADALVVAERGKENDHWSATARLVLRGFNAWVASNPSGKRDLVEVSRLLHLPLAPKDADPDPDAYFDDLLDAMLDEPERAWGVPAAAAGALLSMGHEERGSVLSTVRQNILFVSSPQMATMLSDTGRQPDLKAWKFGGQAIYLCLPAGLLHRHARFFRLFLNRLLAAVEATPPVPRSDPKGLMILDEMHVLGHMNALETAAGLLAGYGVRIWSIWQDFTQAEAIYGKRWQTFLGNASLFQSFGLNDLMTLKFVSDRLGPSSVMKISKGEISYAQSEKGFRGESSSIESTPLLTPDEVAYHFSRQAEAQLVIYPGASPIWMRRLNYWNDEFAEVRKSDVS